MLSGTSRQGHAEVCRRRRRMEEALRTVSAGQIRLSRQQERKHEELLEDRGGGPEGGEEAGPERGGPRTEKER